MITEQRPWGSFTIIEDTATHKLKKIVVKPKQRLSYQSHEKRAEVWTFISGEGKFTLNDDVGLVTKGSVCIIPIGFKHRIENHSESEDLVFFEVQLGEYFGEDDIVRYSDDYGRSNG